MTPTVFREGPTLAKNYGLSEQDANHALKLITDRQQEIRDAWNKHFPGS